MTTKPLNIKIHLKLKQETNLTESNQSIYFQNYNLNQSIPNWFNPFSSTTTSLHQFNQIINNRFISSNFIISTNNAQIIILRSITLLLHHQQLKSLPQSASSPLQLNPSSSTIHSISSSSSSIHSITQLPHIKASPTVSISIPDNLDSNHLSHSSSLPPLNYHPPQALHQQPYTHHHHHHHHHHHPNHSISFHPSNSHSNRSPSSAIPQSPTSSTHSYHPHLSTRLLINHPFESIWQGSNHQTIKSPLFSTTCDPSTSSANPPSENHPQVLLPSPILHPSPLPSSDFSFCASTLISPSTYTDPIVSVKIFTPSNQPQTPLSSFGQPDDPEIPNDLNHSHHHVPNAQDSSESIIFTLTRFGKCSQISPIDGHIINSIDLCQSNGLVPIDDWCFLTDPRAMINDEISEPDNKSRTQENPLILCISSAIEPILLDSLDLSILPMICSGPSIQKEGRFFKTKVWKQSKISNNQWSISLISLTWSKQLCTRELILERDDRSIAWKIEEPLEPILFKDLVDELDLEEQVEFVIDQDRLAVWSSSRFWIFEKPSIAKERNLDSRIHFSKTEAAKKIPHSDDLIVNLSFLDSFGVVLVLKKHIKLFRCIGLQSSTTDCCEWKLAPIDEARFTLEDPFHFEFAINKSSPPSNIDNQVTLINSVNLITVDVDPLTGQRRLSELSFTTVPPSHSAITQVPDPDPDATVTLSATHPRVYHRRRDLHLSSHIIQPNQPKSTCLTCLPDDHHPAILIGDSIGQISIYSLNIPSRNSPTNKVCWKLERLEKQEKLGGPISALYADERWVIAGGLSGDIGVWSRKAMHSTATISTNGPFRDDSYDMQMLNRMVLGAVPVESVGRLPDLDDRRVDGQELNDRVSRFACILIDGSVIVFNLSEIGLIDIDGELPPPEPTIGISELWSNGPEIMVVYHERQLGAQRWLCSKGLLAKLGRQEAQVMIEFENSQLGLKWVRVELSNCEAQSEGSQLDTTRVFNVLGLPAFNILSVKLRDFVESIGLQEGPALAGRLSLVRLMISQLFPWGLDSALDASVERGLGIGRPSMKERLENLNVINGDHDARSGLTLYRNNGDQRVSSEYEKTYRLLHLVVLLRVFLNEACYGRHASQTIEGLARLASSNANNLSDDRTVWLDLKILIEYWLDPSVEVREASRLLAGIRLGSMAQSEIEELVSSWEDFLPIQDIPTAKTENDWRFGRKASSAIQKHQHQIEEIEPKQKHIKEEMQINAMLLIGLIASERYKLLSSKVLKDLSIAVFQAISPSHKLINELRIQILKAGLEICSKTFEIIQNYIDAIELVRNLFGWATGKDGEISGELKGMAKYACLHVASVNTPLFMTTLSYDLMISHNPSDRISTMKLVVFMVRKRPLVLHASLPKLLEAVVKSLDPTQKQMRAQTQTGATVILHELVKTYPSIAFHGPSQKLAIGTPEGAIIIYDLKTSTKINILESFRKPVTACSFSEDGQRLVSVSLDENRIEIWKFNNTPFGLGSFFKFSNTNSNNYALDSHRNNQSTSNTSNSGTTSQPFKSLSFNVGEEAMMSIAGTLEWIRIDWLSNRSCRLRIRQSSITFSC